MLKICIALNFAILKLPTDQAADNISVSHDTLMLIKVKINQMVSPTTSDSPKIIEYSGQKHGSDAQAASLSM
jgi:hypothetical protein